MTYYEIVTDDKRFADRWFLGEPATGDDEQIDAREFTYGHPYRGALPANVPIQQAGRTVKFNLAAFDMPVVTQEIAHQIATIAPDVAEWFPVTIASNINGFVIMNVICCVACVDEQRSIVARWTVSDYRPDRIGKYRMVSNLTIDLSRAYGHDIFRIEDFEIALIVSERIKQLLEPIPDLGIVFRSVS